ncbi:uncharacterized protein si:dkey-125i10.3 isoform X11 [Tachysurus vachellii]|uniref:uncharacterized protein si:dkey-125i10.3 isoform X11 n=1 Tax=Tachysurus vachellii TaxID=175792 RepID=UPI00296B189F|nr:uncharacterized protein si:dkey-125i10.3 isoform X11 [Tachysurus vachellii]
MCVCVCVRCPYIRSELRNLCKSSHSVKTQLKRTKMASDVDRQNVFRTTKVRAALRKDGSWIRRITDGQTDPQPSESPGFLELSPVTASSSSVSKTPTRQTPTPQTPTYQTSTCQTPIPQSPTPQTPTRQTSTPQTPTPQSPTSAQDTATSPGWKGRRGGSYVLSAMRKFESVESPESSPVKTNSSLFKSPEGKSGLTQVTPTLKSDELNITDEVTAPVLKTPEATAPEATAPVVNTPVVNTPVVKTPVVKTPVVNTPVVKTPVVNTPVVNTPVVNTPVVKTPEVTTPVVKTPEVTAPVVKTPVVKTPEVTAPVVNTPVVKTPEVTAPVVNTPVVNTPVVNTPEVTAPVVNTPVVNTPVVNTPEVTTPVVKTPEVTARVTDVDKVLCSFCNKPMEGDEKISLNIPSIVCHVECFQCATCAKSLGDMMSSMFHHCGKIHCKRCFDTVVYST